MNCNTAGFTFLLYRSGHQRMVVFDGSDWESQRNSHHWSWAIPLDAITRSRIPISRCWV